MRRGFLIFMMLALCWRAAAADVMALATLSPLQRTAAHSVTEHDAAASQPRPCHSIADADIETEGMDHSAGASCASCDVCHSTALATWTPLCMALAPSMAQPQAPRWVCLSALPARGYKPPIL